MSFWTPDSIRAAAGGAWLARPDPSRLEQGEVVGISIDTRTIRPGEVYIAIRGDRLDGGAFVGDAVKKGASVIIAEGDATGAGPCVGVIRVPEARSALLRLGKVFRRTWENVRVIAVTGSNGKTTTVRLIDAALSSKKRGVASVKSFNNEIGVPLTLLRVRPGDQYVLCEVGMNAPGEIAPLADAIAPDAAVITSVGRAHIEAFGSVEGIAREKGSLLAGLKPGGLAVIPCGVPALDDAVRAAGSPNVVTFGEDERADLRVTEARHVEVEGGTQLRFTINARWTFEVPMPGLHNALNATAAVAVARRLGLDDDDIRSGLLCAKPPEMRLQRRSIGAVSLLNDAYNANPDSALAAVRTFLSLFPDARRRVVVLGDMRELGAFGPEAHREVARAMIELSGAGPARIDLAITIGELARSSADELVRAWGPSRVEALPPIDEGDVSGAARRAADLLRQGDAVLLKGSRGAGLERVERALEALHGPPRTNPAPLVR